MEKLALTDLDLTGKKVLMRVDFNVPLQANGQTSDNARIVACLPSIRYILAKGASLILMSHLGRPKGKQAAQSLAPCAKELSSLLNQEVILAPDCIGSEVSTLCAKLAPGEVLLLENLRFHPEEEAGELNFAKQLAALGDIYVNEAFGTAHRAHASTAVIAQFFPNKAAAGFLMQKEINFLSHALTNPKRPFSAIIGGAKISTKIGTLKALLPKVETLMIGGAMAFTFLKAQGISIGKSLYEEEFLEAAKKIISDSQKQGTVLLLPIDHLVASAISPDAHTQIVTGFIPPELIGADIGPQTIRLFKAAIDNSPTILWNGPVGVFEMPPFAHGTLAIATAIAQAKALSIAGGGETLAAIAAAGVAEKFTHLSTGGGASLELLEFGTLPGIEALSNKASNF